MFFCHVSIHQYHLDFLGVAVSEWPMVVVGLGQSFLTQVRPATSKSGKFSPKYQIFQFFSLRFKKISSGQVKNYPNQRWVDTLFTAGQKYARERERAIGING